MIRDRIEGNWKQLTDSLKRRWGRLIDDQFHLWAGRRDRPKQGVDGQARQPETGHPKQQASYFLK